MFIYLIEGINMIKGIYETKTANIPLNGERTNVFSLQSRIRQECLFLPLCLPLLFNVILEDLARAIMQKANKRHIE